MSEKKKMYRTPIELTNSSSMYGKDYIEAVFVTTGRKYFTDTKGNRYEIASKDVNLNGDVFYMSDEGQYCPEWYLYETQEAAKNFVKRRALVFKFNNYNFDKLSFEKLCEIEAVLQKSV